MFMIDDKTCLKCKLCLKSCKLDGAGVIHETKDGRVLIDIFYNFLKYDSHFLIRTGAKSCSRCQACFLVCPSSSVKCLYNYTPVESDKPKVIKMMEDVVKSIPDKISLSKDDVESVVKLIEIDYLDD